LPRGKRSTVSAPSIERERTRYPLDVSVRNRNVTVAGLTSADFRLLDNKVTQTITAVVLESLPIDVTLFLDTSPSTAGKHDSLKSDVRTIAGMLRPDDRLRLLTFDSKIRDVFGWQAPTAELRRSELRRSRTSATRWWQD
jgi:hypothetical protein